MKTKSVFVFLAALAALRCGWVALHGIAPQEAYYWMCSERLAPAFFDGPPGTAVLMDAFDVFGLPALPAARFAWPVLAFAAGGLAWLLARRLYDGTVAAWTVILLNALPVFNSGAVTVGPAMPALVAVLAGMSVAWLAWSGHRIFWGAAGAAFALAACFRYEAALVPAGLLAMALASPRHRSRGDLAGLAAVAILSALALWRPMAWNSSWEWIPVAGGTLRTAWAFQAIGCAERLWDFFASFSVFAGLALLAGIVWMVREARQHGRPRFLLAVCGPLWIWWIYCTLRGEGGEIAALLGSVPVAIFVFATVRKSAWAASIASAAVVVALFAGGLALWRESLERAGWPALAREFRSAAREIPAGDKEGFFIAESPDLAAVLGYYLSEKQKGLPPPVFIPESPDLSSQFGIWPSYADFVESAQVADENFTEQKGINPFVGRSALFLGTELPQTIDGAFVSVSPMRRIRLPDGRIFTVFLCIDYQTLPL